MFRSKNERCDGSIGKGMVGCFMRKEDQMRSTFGDVSDPSSSAAAVRIAMTPYTSHSPSSSSCWMRAYKVSSSRGLSRGSLRDQTVLSDVLIMPFSLETSQQHSKCHGIGSAVRPSIHGHFITVAMWEEQESRPLGGEVPPRSWCWTGRWSLRGIPQRNEAGMVSSPAPRAAFKWNGSLPSMGGNSDLSSGGTMEIIGLSPDRYKAFTAPCVRSSAAMDRCTRHVHCEHRADQDNPKA